MSRVMLYLTAIFLIIEPAMAGADDRFSPSGEPGEGAACSKKTYPTGALGANPNYIDLNLDEARALFGEIRIHYSSEADENNEASIRFYMPRACEDAFQVTAYTRVAGYLGFGIRARKGNDLSCFKGEAGERIPCESRTYRNNNPDRCFLAKRRLDVGSGIEDFDGQVGFGQMIEDMGEYRFCLNKTHEAVSMGAKQAKAEQARRQAEAEEKANIIGQIEHCLEENKLDEARQWIQKFEDDFGSLSATLRAQFDAALAVEELARGEAHYEGLKERIREADSLSQVRALEREIQHFGINHADYLAANPGIDLDKLRKNLYERALPKIEDTEEVIDLKDRALSWASKSGTKKYFQGILNKAVEGFIKACGSKTQCYRQAEAMMIETADEHATDIGEAKANEIKRDSFKIVVAEGEVAARRGNTAYFSSLFGPSLYDRLVQRGQERVMESCFFGTQKEINLGFNDTWKIGTIFYEDRDPADPYEDAGQLENCSADMEALTQVAALPQIAQNVQNLGPQLQKAFANLPALLSGIDGTGLNANQSLLDLAGASQNPSVTQLLNQLAAQKEGNIFLGKYLDQTSPIFPEATNPSASIWGIPLSSFQTVPGASVWNPLLVK